jgi:hypothetical protein
MMTDTSGREESSASESGNGESVLVTVNASKGLPFLRDGAQPQSQAWPERLAQKRKGPRNAVGTYPGTIKNQKTKCGLPNLFLSGLHNNLIELLGSSCRLAGYGTDNTTNNGACAGSDGCGRTYVSTTHGGTNTGTKSGATQSACTCTNQNSLRAVRTGTSATCECNCGGQNYYGQRRTINRSHDLYSFREKR